MKIQRFETPGIAHFAYLLADEGVAAIVDPRRDVDEYLEVARQLGVRIDYVLETHRQEDFVLGSAHLAARTGARVVNGTHPLFGRGDIRLDDGDSIELGSLTIHALHTPGHTPESMSYAVFPTETPRQAWGVFTGDALFFGDTGRTDLPGIEQTADNAGLLHDSVHGKLAPLGDAALVLPAHGPGSVCGSGMADRPMSTIGAEKRYNKVFTLDRDAFVRHKSSERLPRPPYFRHMEEVNLRGGLPPVRLPDQVPLLSPAELSQRSGGSILIDAREPEAYAGGHIPEAYAIWLGGMPVFGGWIASPQTPVYLYGDRDVDGARAAEHLSRIGIDEVRGILAAGFGSWRKSGRHIETAAVITPRRLAERGDGLTVLDVRDQDEFDAGHIRGAVHAYVGTLEQQLPALGLDPAAPVVVTCSVGHRAGLGVSILRRAGFTDVRNLLGGMTAWNKLELRTETGRAA